MDSSVLHTDLHSLNVQLLCFLSQVFKHFSPPLHFYQPFLCSIFLLVRPSWRWNIWTSSNIIIIDLVFQGQLLARFTDLRLEWTCSDVRAWPCLVLMRAIFFQLLEALGLSSSTISCYLPWEITNMCMWPISTLIINPQMLTIIGDKRLKENV